MGDNACIEALKVTVALANEKQIFKLVSCLSKTELKRLYTGQPVKHMQC